jgi:imidazolonepropionase-like amidohydrolase
MPGHRHAYRAERAFDGDRALSDGALVLVEGAVIIGVEPASAPVPDGWELHEEPGATLLPGLIETHTHLCADSGPRALDQLGEIDDDTLDAIVAESLRAELAAGVTTVRDLGDARWAVVDRRGRHSGPTILASGPPITSPQGHCWNMGGETSGEQALRAAVRERAERGADLVKIMLSGGVMTVTTDYLANQFTLDEVRAVVDEAHRQGLPVTGHAHPIGAIELALDAGVDGIEHCTCITETGFHTPPELVDRLAAAQVVVCPTLGIAPGAVPPPPVLALMERTGTTTAQRIAHYGALAAAGVGLISGSDSGINPGKRHGILPYAVADLVDAGVDPSTALASTTGAAADALDIADRTGRLRAGLAADLLLVDGDPTVDVATLVHVRTVVLRGVATTAR